MAISEQQRQKKLAKKKQKRIAAAKTITPTMQKAQGYASYPIHECLIPKDLFTNGLGELIVTRRLPNNQIAIAAFVVDVGCLGVKDAVFVVMSLYEYENDFMEKITQKGTRDFEKIHQSCAKSLIDGAVDYAKEIGFSPHPDYKNVYKIFGTIDASVCPVKYEYGKDGKPFYMNGPYETPADVERTLKTLNKKCGVDGFHYLLIDTDEHDAPFYNEDNED